MLRSTYFSWKRIPSTVLPSFSRSFQPRIPFNPPSRFTSLKPFGIYSSPFSHHRLFATCSCSLEPSMSCVSSSFISSPIQDPGSVHVFSPIPPSMVDFSTTPQTQSSSLSLQEPTSPPPTFILKCGKEEQNTWIWVMKCICIGVTGFMMNIMAVLQDRRPEFLIAMGLYIIAITII